jgi:hypothetical protein
MRRNFSPETPEKARAEPGSLSYTGTPLAGKQA